MKFSRLLIFAPVLLAPSIHPAQAGTAANGTVYIGAAFGTHNVYKVEFSYDGVASMTANATVLTTLPTAVDALIVPGGDIIVAAGPNVYRSEFGHRRAHDCQFQQQWQYRVAGPKWG